MLARRPMQARIGWAIVLALAVWTAAPLAVLAYHTIRHGGVLSGTDGALAGADQLFYMDSIRQSAQHILITDHFDLALGRPVFLSPLYLGAGLLWGAGVSIQATFWLLQLTAAVVLGMGVTVFVRQCLPTAGQQLAAAALGLFYLSPLVALLAFTGAISPLTRFDLTFPSGESMPAWQLWGYPHAAISAGLLAAAAAGAVALVGRRRRRPGLVAGTSVAALLVGWLHPWQGAELIVILGALLAYSRSRSTAGVLLLPMLSAVIPMAYEAVLIHTDAAWRLDSGQNAVGHVSLWMLLLALLPLLLVALAGLRARFAGATRLVLAVWPVAGLAVYFAASQFPYHALQGISIPLAVLAVAGWSELRGRRSVRNWRWAGASAAAIAVVAGIAFEADTFANSTGAGVAPYWLTAGERDALAYLDHAREPGGVFAGYYLGMAVPAYTGRRTWLGEYAWTPHFSRRVVLADDLLEGRLPSARARQLVERAGARFALEPCGSRESATRLLSSIAVGRRAFGCVTVYLLPAPGLGRRRAHVGVGPGSQRTNVR